MNETESFLGNQQVLLECVFEDILTNRDLVGWFGLSDIDWVENRQKIRTVLDKLERKQYLISDSQQNRWQINPEIRLSHVESNSGTPHPERDHYAIPLDVKRKTLSSELSNDPESVEHLWGKYALTFHFPVEVEPYDDKRRPDALYRLQRRKSNLNDIVYLVCCSPPKKYPHQNSLVEQILDYLMRKDGVRIILLDGRTTVKNAVYDELSRIGAEQLNLGAFNPSEGWIKVGQAITPNNISYRITEGDYKHTGNKAIREFSDEMVPSVIEGGSWKLDTDVHPSGFMHIGTFQFSEYSDSNDSLRKQYSALGVVEVYANSDASEYIIERKSSAMAKPLLKSRSEMGELVNRLPTTRIGPATGKWLP